MKKKPASIFWGHDPIFMLVAPIMWGHGPNFSQVVWTVPSAIIQPFFELQTPVLAWKFI